TEARELMENKNHDYGEAWRDMRVSSLTDLIIQKILRVKQIEDNKGKTLVSEGIDANYQDMINYAVFAMILMEEAVASHALKNEDTCRDHQDICWNIIYYFRLYKTQ